MTKSKRLSRTQIRMLTNVRDGLSPTDHCRGMSEYGGADGTLRSLVARGLLAYVGPRQDVVITAAGRVALRDL